MALLIYCWYLHSGGEVAVVTPLMVVVVVAFGVVVVGVAVVLFLLLWFCCISCWWLGRWIPFVYCSCRNGSGKKIFWPQPWMITDRHRK